MHGTGDVRFFDRFTPVYDSVTSPVDPSALGTVLGCAGRGVECVVGIGGGSGRATFAPSVLERTILDRSAGILHRTRGRGLNCVHDDARKPSFVGDSLDAVVVVDAFYHIPNQRGIAGEVFHVLASDGVFVISEFDPEAFFGRGLVAVGRVIGFGLAFAASNELVCFLEHVDFETAVVEYNSEYTVVGKKQESH